LLLELAAQVSYPKPRMGYRSALGQILTGLGEPRGLALGEGGSLKTRRTISADPMKFSIETRIIFSGF